MAESAQTRDRRRDYSMFDAELSGAVLNLKLLRRLLGWMRPYRITFATSAVLVVVASYLQVLLPVILSIVVIDHILMGTTESATPDLGMVAANDWIAVTLGVHPLIAACVLYGIIYLVFAVISHAHRMTLVSSVRMVCFLLPMMPENTKL